jgi:hypothetical protein
LDNPTRRIALMIALTGLLLAGAIAFNYSINPYGAWRCTLIDPVYRNLTGDRAQMPYQLWTTAPETLLIGSSRVQMGMRIEQGYRAGVLNASLGAATMPELAKIISVALQNQKLKRIVWGVDFYAFNERLHHQNPSFDRRIELDPAVLIEDSLLSLSALSDSFEVLKRAIRGGRRLKPVISAGVPWPPDLICAQLSLQHLHGLAIAKPVNIETSLAQVQAWFYADYEFSPALAARFHEVVDMVRGHKVEVILFVPPMSKYELELIRQGGHWPDFERFKRTVAAAGPLWDFAAYNRLASTDALFLDVLHLKPAGGNAMLRIMLGMEPALCDLDARIVAESAMHVDAGAIDAVLAFESREQDKAVVNASSYSRIAAAALRDPASRRSATPPSQMD